MIHPLHQATHDDIRRSYLKTPQTRDGDTPEVSKALAEDDDKTLQAEPETDKTGHLWNLQTEDTMTTLVVLGHRPRNLERTQVRQHASVCLDNDPVWRSSLGLTTCTSQAFTVQESFKLQLQIMK